MPPKPRVSASRARLGSHRPRKNAKSRREFEIASFVPSREFRAVSRKPSFCRTNVTSASRVRTRRDSRMADIEDNTASARAKRPVGIASAAGRRERRAPASKVRAASVNKKPPVFVPALSPRDSDCERRRRRARDARDADDSPPPFPTIRAIAQDLDIEHVKPTRRAAASAAAAEHSSDHSEDTGIEGTDAPENATARPASRGKAAPRKGAPAPDTKAASSGSDEDSAAATPKLAKAAKATAQAKKKETPAGKTEEVAVRQRPTNNQLLCVSRDARARSERRDAARPTRPTRRVPCRRFPRPRGPARVYASRASPRIPADDHLPLAIFALPRDHASSRLPIADRAGTRLGSTGSTTPTRSRRERARCFPARPRRAPRSRPPSSRYVPRAIVARLTPRRDVFLFSVLFADCASARCRVCLSTRKRRDGFRNAIVGRVGARTRQRALDRARSVACASPRWTRFAYLRVFSRARRAEEHRATPFEAVSVSLGASDASRVTTRREGGR